MASLPEQRQRNNERLQVRALELAMHELLTYLTKFEKSEKLMDTIRSRVKTEIQEYPKRVFPGNTIVSMIDEGLLWQSINSWLPKEDK